MQKLYHYFGRIIVLTVCSIAVLGCDSPIPMYDPLLEMTVEDSLSGTSDDGATTSEVAAMRKRVLEVYSEYWPLISSEEQHKRLPSVLIDTIPELRVFGIERVAMLLRDGEAQEEELLLVVTRLRDPNLRVRRDAAKLLPEINVNDLSAYETSSNGHPISLSKYVADSLVLEPNQRVAALELDFFQTRPHADAVDPAIDRLERGPVDGAAQTLFVLLNANYVSADLKIRIFKIVQRSPQQRKLPSLLTLEAMLGDSKVQRGMTGFLHDSNESIRLAVARGFASAGYAEPLIALKDNPDIFSFALTALKNRGDIEAFHELMDLHKEGEVDWEEAVHAIARALDIRSLGRASDTLARLGMDELRLSILKSRWENSSSRSFPERKAIALLTAPLLIEAGNAVEVLQLLVDAFEDPLVDDDLLTLRFRAAITASAWDTAEDTRSEPGKWIEEYEKAKHDSKPTADAIHEQILVRFEDKLTASQLESLDKVQVNVTPGENQ